MKIITSHVHHTGKRNVRFPNSRGKKPIGWNVYKSGLYVGYIENKYKTYAAPHEEFEKLIYNK